MKKIFLILLIIFPFGIKALEYGINSEKIKGMFDDSWYVFTKDSASYDALEDGITKSSVEAILENDLIHLYAITNGKNKLDKNIELFLKITDSGKYKGNLNNYSDDQVTKVADEISNLVSINDYKIYGNDKYKYVVINYKVKDYDMLLFHTIIDDKCLEFITQKQGKFTIEEKNALTDLIEKLDDLNIIYYENNKKSNNLLKIFIPISAIICATVVIIIVKKRKSK